MNFSEIKSAVNHLLKTSRCVKCKDGYTPKDVHIIATTKHEGLFEIKCGKCHLSTIVTVFLSPEIEIKQQNEQRQHLGISENDVLDVKNFLNNFDGNFKKLFTNGQ